MNLTYDAEGNLEHPWWKCPNNDAHELHLTHNRLNRLFPQPVCTVCKVKAVFEKNSETTARRHLCRSSD